MALVDPITRPETQTTPRKASELLREAARLGLEQNYECAVSARRELNDKTSWTFCALGAMAWLRDEAKTRELYSRGQYEAIEQLGGDALTQPVVPNERIPLESLRWGRTSWRTLSGVIMDLNDDQKWSFEQIAEWLESIGE